MDDHLRQSIKNELCEEGIDNLRDFDLRVDAILYGLKGLENMTDQELMDEYLNTFGSAKEFEDFHRDDDGVLGGIIKEVVDTVEYRTYWESKAKSTEQEGN